MNPAYQVWDLSDELEARHQDWRYELVLSPPLFMSGKTRTDPGKPLDRRYDENLKIWSLVTL